MNGDQEQELTVLVAIESRGYWKLDANVFETILVYCQLYGAG